jgi:hypothetical protein
LQMPALDLLCEFEQCPGLPGEITKITHK